MFDMLKVLQMWVMQLYFVNLLWQLMLQPHYNTMQSHYLHHLYSEVTVSLMIKNNKFANFTNNQQTNLSWISKIAYYNYTVFVAEH